MIIKNNVIDFLGINYYSPARVQAPILNNRNNKDSSRWFSPYVDPKARMNIYRGWEIYPESINNICDIMQRDYPDTNWFISENGMGVQDEQRFLNSDGIIDDQYRIEFIKDHLMVLLKQIKENKVKCFAYCVWAPIDCWSWANAYKNRYGLISIDLFNQKRSIKSSGHFFKRVASGEDF